MVSDLFSGPSGPSTRSAQVRGLYLSRSYKVLARKFRLRLQRGISYLATPQMIRSISDLVKLGIEGIGIKNEASG